MEAALLPLAPRSPSQLDPDTQDNRTQARYELHRALDFGGEGDLAAWARRWGPGFVDGAEGLHAEIATLEDQIGEVEAERDAPLDTSDIHGDLDEARECIGTALEGLAIIDGADDAVAQLKDGLDFIAKASKGLDSL